MRRTLLVALGIGLILGFAGPIYAQKPRTATIAASLGQQIGSWWVVACHPKTMELTLRTSGYDSVAVRVVEGDWIRAYDPWSIWTQRARLEKVENCTGIFELEQ